jgi:hypothetical protein
LGFLLRVISKSKAIAIDDVGLEEEFGVEGLIDDRVGWFGEQVCEQNWLLSAGRWWWGYLTAFVN